jgi:hypothetical protein
MIIFRYIHRRLNAVGISIGEYTLFGCALILHLLPFAAFCGSIYLVAILVDAIGGGLLLGIPIAVLWFFFVCFYVADRVQPQVGRAAASLS